METKILNRKRILPSLFLIIFCTAVLRFILEGMTSGYQRTAGSPVIMYRFIFPSLILFPLGWFLLISFLGKQFVERNLGCC